MVHQVQVKKDEKILDTFVDYISSFLPETKKGTHNPVWVILLGLNDNSIYGHHNPRIKNDTSLFFTDVSCSCQSFVSCHRKENSSERHGPFVPDQK